ncbi:coiled-coil domain-containing protein [Slackia piriformis]
MAEQNMHLTRRAFVGGAAAFGVVSLGVPSVAFADPTSADKQAEADAVRVKLDDMQSKLSKASDDYYTALEEHDVATQKMDEAQTKIDENNVRIAELQERLGGRARSMYRNGQTTFLDILVGSASFDDFLKNWDSLETLNDNDAKLVSETKTLREDNEAQKAEYSAQADTAKQKMDEASAIKTEAEALVVQYQAEVDSLDAEVAALVEQERQAAAEAAAAAQAASFKEEERTQESSDNTDSNSGGSTGGSTGGGNTGGGTGGGGTAGGGSTGGGSTSGGTGSGTPNTAALGVAQTQLGVPYVWGGSTPGVGLDCSGLTSYCYSATGYSIGRTTGAQYSSARYVLSLGEAQPGDVLYTGGHVGICASAGGGSYIHAPQPGEVVCYSSWQQFYCALRW